MKKRGPNKPLGVDHVVGEATPTARSLSELHMDHAKKGLSPKKRRPDMVRKPEDRKP